MAWAWAIASLLTCSTQVAAVGDDTRSSVGRELNLGCDIHNFDLPSGKTCNQYWTNIDCYTRCCVVQLNFCKRDNQCMLDRSCAYPDTHGCPVNYDGANCGDYGDKPLC